MSAFEGQQPPVDGVDEYEQDEVDKAIEEAGITSGDLADMAELEKDMNNSNLDDSSTPSPSNGSSGGASVSSSGASRGPAKGGFMPAGAMPTTSNGGLSSMANEFWFPESRNCKCCKGYKHGCKCRVGSVEVCQDPDCTTNVGSIESDIKIEPVKERRKPKIVFKNNATPAPAPAPAPASAPAFVPAPAPVPAPINVAATSGAPPGGAPSPQMCTFFNTPQGCRFGNTCRFTHAAPSPGGSPLVGAPGPMGSPPGQEVGGPGPDSQQPCRFFRQGSCRNGPSCRFAHI